MNDAEQAVDAALRHGTPRSPEYRAGMLAAYSARMAGAEIALPPYRIGTAQCDAWFAGVARGKALWLRLSAHPSTWTGPDLPA